MLSRCRCVALACPQHLSVARAPRSRCASGSLGASPDTTTLFIDGDNISPQALRPILQVLRERDLAISYGRVYISNHQGSWQRVARAEGLQPVLVPKLGLKDPSDLMLALDAAEACLQGRCSAVAVASEERRSVVRRCSSLAARKTDRASLHRVPSVPREDLDFTFLLRKARARHAGAEAVHLGFLTQRCVPSRNELRHWGCRTLLVLPQRRASRSRQHLEMEANEVLSFQERQVGQPQEHPIQLTSAPVSEERQRQMERLQKLLQELKYLPLPPQQGVMRAALAKFFHVNGLGPLTLWPLHEALTEAGEGHGAFANLDSPDAGWRADPGHLIFIQPRTTEGRGVSKLAHGGPFLTQDGEDLLWRLLHTLGYEISQPRQATGPLRRT
eukprot:g19378.t1